jgi:hypothetical protein
MSRRYIYRRDNIGGILIGTLLAMTLVIGVLATLYLRRGELPLPVLGICAIMLCIVAMVLLSGIVDKLSKRCDFVYLSQTHITWGLWTKRGIQWQKRIALFPGDRVEFVYEHRPSDSGVGRLYELRIDGRTVVEHHSAEFINEIVAGLVSFGHRVSKPPPSPK